MIRKGTEVVDSYGRWFVVDEVTSYGTFICVDEDGGEEELTENEINLAWHRPKKGCRFHANFTEKSA